MSDLYDFGGQQAEIARKQMIAKMLMEQGSAPIESQNAGRFVAPISPWQGAAKMFAAYQGNKAAREADEKTSEYNKKANQDLAEAIKVWQTGDTTTAMQMFSNNPKGQPYAQMLAKTIAGQKPIQDSDLVGKYTPESIQQFKGTQGKDFSVLVPYEKPRKQEWWQSPEGIAARQSVAAAGKPSVTVDVNTGPKSFWNDFGKAQAKDFQGQQDAAKNAANQVIQINDARKLLDGGVFSGTGAEIKLKAGKALKAMGFNVADDEIANTEAFTAQMGQQVLSHIKTLGANPSNTDRDFIEKVVGGRIDLDEKTMRKLLDMNEKYSREVIRKYNKSAEAVKADPNYQNMPLDIMVNEPPAYQGQSVDLQQDDPVTAEMKRRGLM